MVSQGDIFQFADRVQLTIVFGHVGFNQIRLYWDSFARKHPYLKNINNPFMDLKEHPVEWSPDKWLWFIPEGKNSGMTETQLTHSLDTALTWALQNGVTSAATNGIADTNHGHDTVANRRSDEIRAAWLIDYARHAKLKYHVDLQLISLNDVFVRSS